MVDGVRQHKLIILAAWAVVQTLLLTSQGIMITGESDKYLHQADRLLNGLPYSTPNFSFYSIEIFILALDKLLSATFFFALFIHLALNLISTFAFFNIARKLFTHKQALFCTIALLINLPYQQFNVMMQTESVYFSLSVILAAAAFSIRLPSRIKFLLVSVLLLAIIFCRPTGALFIIPLLIYALVTFGRKLSSSKKIITICGFLGACALIVDGAMSSGGELDFMLPFAFEHIICGVATLPEAAAIRTSPQGNSLYGLLYYIIHNPGHFITLAIKRTISFFGLVRDYYSIGHNILLAVYFYPLYAAVLFGFRNVTNKPIRAYLIAAMITVWTTTMLTCDDWHNRFLISISPFLLLVGWAALNKLFNRTQARAKSS